MSLSRYGEDANWFGPNPPGDDDTLADCQRALAERFDYVDMELVEDDA